VGTKITISVVCILLAIAHKVWPDAAPDLTTTILLLVALLPWLTSVIRSVELPGGFRIELQDVKTATKKVAAGAPQRHGAGASRTPATMRLLTHVGSEDPNLALVALRIEIEKRLAELASTLKLEFGRKSARQLLRDLVPAQGIDRETASGLDDLIALGNQAAHGARVAEDAAVWALEMAPSVLDVLDNLIDNAKAG
jgi:hypothetical protein